MPEMDSEVDPAKEQPGIEEEKKNQNTSKALLVVY